MSPKVLVLVHGLCMNDLQWRHEGHDHGEPLARELGYMPVYRHYNTGLAVSANGRLLAGSLARLRAAWPTRIERLVVIGHSMGGLVARSALLHGTEAPSRGADRSLRVDDLVCLGTPHQGAPLERIGHLADGVIGALPWAAPLARLGRARSAGIQDLRHGAVGRPGVGGRGMDMGTEAGPSPALPDGTRCFAIAAHLGPSRGRAAAAVLGDGLVPVDIALGRHRRADRHVGFALQHLAVVADTSHRGLLSSPAVYDRLRRWLG